MNLIALLLVLLILPLPLPGCSRPSVAESGLRVTKMRIGSQNFTLEIADTDATRTQGLMGRKSMPDDHGMIFVFPDEQPRAFWMMNTHIPLDLIYLDAAGRILSIHQLKPFDATGVRSEGAAKYAIELNQGAAARAGIKKGDLLTIPKEAAEPAR